MKLLIENRIVETKDIADIVEIEKYKKHFTNREAGFIITFFDNSTMTFREPIPYESYPREIGEIKERWDKLMNSVVEKWQSDKTEITTLKL